MANVHKKNSYNNRKFLTFSDDPLRLKPRLTSLSKKHEDVSKLIRYVDDNIVGKNNAFYGPFGRRKGTSYNYIKINVRSCTVKQNVFVTVSILVYEDHQKYYYIF